MKRIFIGGLGRSGTTITLNAFHRHDAVFAVPMETKFLVEEDGFAQLVSALTRDFSVACTGVAVERFDVLMRRSVPGLQDGKFCRQHALPTSVFENYNLAVDAFMRVVGSRRFCADRAPLIAATRQFVSATFDAEARKSGRDVWAEKTPSNVWRLDFLREAWPDSLFVHCLRDPRDILISLMERRWLPAEPLAAVVMFKDYVDALLRVRRAHADDPNWIELRLEDLVARTQHTLDLLAKRLDIAPFQHDTGAAVSETIEGYYTGKARAVVTLGEADQRLIVELLRPAAVELGYSEDWRSNA